MGDVAGSGIKPAPQKGRGASRQGNKRAPQRAGGGKAHGPVPRSLEFPINSKMRLIALKTILSAKLYEDKIIVIDAGQIEYPKTQLLEHIIRPFGLDRLLFLTPSSKQQDHFEMAARNLQNVTLKNAQQFNLPDLLRTDYIFLTKQGLVELEEVIEKRHENLFRNKKVPTEDGILRSRLRAMDHFERDIIDPTLNSKKIKGYDDDLPLIVQTPALKTMVKDLRVFVGKEGNRKHEEKLKAEENKKEAVASE